MTLWLLLVFFIVHILYASGNFFFFFLRVHIYVCVCVCDHGDWEIKHHMMATVIASETTEHIKKNPLPSVHVLLPHPLPLMELLPYLSQRKRRLAETIQTTAHPRG